MTHATDPAPQHVLVVGAGGIGCPAAWGLVARNVPAVTLVDPDVVEVSNLPRQVLYTPDDVGRAKAVVAAARLGGATRGIEGVHARLDESNADALLARADVVIDATDGARTKDWLNQLAVRRNVPLVHAAGLRAEARLLPVAAGGRPCLACLFGRLEEETGSCADLGVWNGAVGAVGFLAAEAAFALVANRAQSTYQVLDFETLRRTDLSVRPDDACPICASSNGDVEAYPIDAGCAPPVPVERAAPGDVLDLIEERCPMNLLRARRALEDRQPGDVLEIHLGAEGAATVPSGVQALGHDVLLREPLGAGLRLRVRSGGSSKGGASRPGEHARLDHGMLKRFARQVVLPEIGEAGQARLRDASVCVSGDGPALASCALYMAAAGVGALFVQGNSDDAPLGGGLVDLCAERSIGNVTACVQEPSVDVRCSTTDVDDVKSIAGADALAQGAVLAHRVQQQLLAQT